MSGNDIFEMDSATETEEMDGDIELAMIDEEVGKTTALVCRKRSDVLVCMCSVGSLSGLNPS